MLKYCESFGIKVLRMPRESSRSRENKTYLAGDNSYLCWTARWRFRRPDRSIAFEIVLNQIDDIFPLRDILRLIVRTAPNDEVAICSPENSTVLIVAEGVQGGGYFQADIELGLRDNLFSKTVIEFPILEVVPTQCIADWKIVTLCDVEEVQMPKVEPTPEPEPLPDLPTYHEIKKALKRDIIQGVLNGAADDAPVPQ
jgi:hypothetical protein